MSDVPPPPPVSPGSGSTPGGPVDVGQAVGYSWRKFQQYAGPLLTIVAVVVVVNLVGALIRANTSSRFLGLILVIVFWVVGQIGLAMCGIGLLVTAPISQIMLAYVYRSLTGQSIAP